MSKTLINLEITSIHVFQHPNGPDAILFDTNLPNGEYPYTGVSVLKLHVASGTGAEYVRTNFPGVEATLRVY